MGSDNTNSWSLHTCYFHRKEMLLLLIYVKKYGIHIGSQLCRVTQNALLTANSCIQRVRSMRITMSEWLRHCAYTCKVGWEIM